MGCRNPLMPVTAPQLRVNPSAIEASKDRVDPERTEYRQKLYDAQKIFMQEMEVD